MDQPIKCISNQNQIKPINPSINKTKSNSSNAPTHQMQIKPKPNQTDQPIYHYGSLNVEATTTMAEACGGEEG